MATPASANQGIPMPDDAEYLKDVPDFVRAMGLAIEKKLVMSFASSSDRATRVPSPVEGMVSWLRDLNRLYVYTGSTWAQVYPPTPTVTSGTAAPTGSGAVGDIYIQY